MAAATTASARSAENSTLGVVAMYCTLPDMKGSSAGRVSWEATPSGRAGEGVALAAVDVAERAMAWRRRQNESFITHVSIALRAGGMR